ncbi:universal stress protein [Alkalinema sp. FACHB-956]|uniref:universal stress protein n=1 Tax=Alkalinema sp. FACHB-956 TaxID=2692768 RepID=UPI00168521A8|nr:universal stress protein [Alkalinema sp. FACHB-956]MBD2328752.1 universal stress protein [Alkalinema sp. FACHB-956]
MLARLQGTLTQTDVEQMILLSSDRRSSVEGKDINLVVGYSNSPKSQAALDLTLWIAHQTRLATSQLVTVQVVYVVEDTLTTPFTSASDWRTISRVDARRGQGLRTSEAVLSTLGGDSSSSQRRSNVAVLEAPTDRIHQFEQADHILWQARCLADEWRGSLKTHLRFGQVAQELRHVVTDEEATLLIVGCQSTKAPLIRQLGKTFPCPVLGVPELENE